MRIGRGRLATRKAPPALRTASFPIRQTLLPWATGLALIWGLASSAGACDTPTVTVDIPDGRTATEEQMAMAQQAVQAYVGEAEAYIACLEGSDMAAVQVRRLRDQTIDEMERHAAQFNRQLRHFRNR